MVVDALPLMIGMEQHAMDQVIVIVGIGHKTIVVRDTVEPIVGVDVLVEDTLIGVVGIGQVIHMARHQVRHVMISIIAGAVANYINIKYSWNKNILTIFFNIRHILYK